MLISLTTLSISLEIKKVNKMMKILVAKIKILLMKKVAIQVRKNQFMKMKMKKIQLKDTLVIIKTSKERTELMKRAKS
jgi:hypothetical protein